MCVHCHSPGRLIQKGNEESLTLQHSVKSVAFSLIVHIKRQLTIAGAVEKQRKLCSLKTLGSKEKRESPLPCTGLSSHSVHHPSPGLTSPLMLEGAHTGEIEGETRCVTPVASYQRQDWPSVSSVTGQVNPVCSVCRGCVPSATLRCACVPFSYAELCTGLGQCAFTNLSQRPQQCGTGGNYGNKPCPGASPLLGTL